MRHLADEAGLGEAIHVESAGTGAWHVGEPPDARSTAAAKRAGVVLEGQAQLFGPEDFARFDYVLAVDRPNYQRLVAMTRDQAARSRVHMLRSFDPGAPAGAEVPDPYYGGPSGFDDVFHICAAACRGLLAHLRAAHKLS